MDSISIKDYLNIKEVNMYLEDRKQLILNENGGFSTLETEQLTELINGLNQIINKLENKN